jgi:hypothetical protein
VSVPVWVLEGVRISLVVVGRIWSVFAGARSADRTKSKAALRGVGVSLVVRGASDPFLLALSLPTERSQRRLSVV